MSNLEKLKQFLSLFCRTSKVLIVINADPDSIASGMAVKRLLWRKAAEISIVYFNRITRPDNLTMIELTEPNIQFLDDVDPKAYDRFVIVDSQPDHNEIFSQFTFDAIIDHHPISCQFEGFCDIRPEYGANSTIMTEYLKAAKIKPSRKLSAALMLGIKTDTADFTRQASLKDIHAFQHLYKSADMNIVIKMERALLSQEDLDFLSLAITHRVIRKNRVFFHAGNMTKPDELVMVADFFLRIAKMNWSIISGVYEKTLIIVIRNDGLRKGAGNTAKEAFNCYGSAGGHKTMARAELDLKLIRKDLKSVSQKILKEWIIEKIEETAGKKIE